MIHTAEQKDFSAFGSQFINLVVDVFLQINIFQIIYSQTCIWNTFQYFNMLLIKFQISDLIGNLIFNSSKKVSLKIKNYSTGGIFPKTYEDFLNDIFADCFIFIDFKSV